MSEEHDLKKSSEAAGQLQPVIKDAQGRIIDGVHRKKADPSWREETWGHVKTDEDYWRARAHLNYARRNASEARDEKILIVNSIAKHYLEQGLHVAGRQRADGHESAPVNEVIEAVIKTLDGAISESWIRHNIDQAYIQAQQERQSEAEARDEAGRARIKEHIKDLNKKREDLMKEMIVLDHRFNLYAELKLNAFNVGFMQCPKCGLNLQEHIQAMMNDCYAKKKTVLDQSEKLSGELMMLREKYPELYSEVNQRSRLA